MNDRKKLLELIETTKFAMFTTRGDDGALRSRPMTLLDDDPAGELAFLVARDTGLVADLEADDQVNLAFAEPKDNRFVSLSGRAEIDTDEATIKRLWKPAFRAWFPEGADADAMAVLRVHVESAAYWDAPASRMVQLAGFVKALATGKRARPGEQGRVSFQTPHYPDGDYEAPAERTDGARRPDIIEPLDESPD